MSMLLEHAKSELKIAGYDIESPEKEVFETDSDYANACARNAYEMLEVFSRAEHSGFSASVTLALFNKLAECKCLTPLTNNPDEWIDTSSYNGVIEGIDFEKPGTKFQSKRQPSCFSDDGLKTYYDINEEENRIFELDKDGNRTGWSSLKPSEEMVYHILGSK